MTLTRPHFWNFRFLRAQRVLCNQRSDTTTANNCRSKRRTTSQTRSVLRSASVSARQALSKPQRAHTHLSCERYTQSMHPTHIFPSQKPLQLPAPIPSHWHSQWPGIANAPMHVTLRHDARACFPVPSFSQRCFALNLIVPLSFWS